MHSPPCAFATASTIARPSPEPPRRAAAHRCPRGRSARRCAAGPWAGSRGPRRRPGSRACRPRACERSVIDWAGPVCLTAFSISASSAPQWRRRPPTSVPRPSSSSRHDLGITSDQRTNRSSTRASASSRVARERAGVLGPGEQEQAARSSARSGRARPGRRTDSGAGRRRRGAALEVPARDRDRRAQLVGDVLQELRLALEQLRRRLPPAALLLERAQAIVGRRDAVRAVGRQRP